MNEKWRNFLQKFIKGKEAKILTNQAENVIEDQEKKELIIELKHKHALNKLQKKSLLEQMKQKVKKFYGQDFSLSLRLKPIRTQHNREMKIPHGIHY